MTVLLLCSLQKDMQSMPLFSLCFKISGAFGLSSSPVGINPYNQSPNSYNHWISYSGFNPAGNNGSWSDGTTDAPEWQAGQPSGGGACASGVLR